MPLCAGRFSHCCGPRHVEQSPYVRVSFASASHMELRQGMERLGATLRAAQAAQDGSRRAGSHGSFAAAGGVTAHLPASAAGAAAQPAAESISASGQGASLAAAGQNGHADSAAQSPSTHPHQGTVENGHTASHAPHPASVVSMESPSKGAAEPLLGLRVNEDAGKGVQQSIPFSDSAAKAELAPGSLGITVDALAPKLAKTLDPSDSAWKC